MLTLLTQDGPVILASFLASLVECVEALTVVLAVGATRGWRNALCGAGSALALLAIAVPLFGPALARVPLNAIQIIVGLLLLLFGLRWLRKAILRAAGVIPLHDETEAYAKTARALGRGQGAGWDRVGLATAFKITMLEGVEVVFIVLALGGAGGMLAPAAGGAGLALLVVVLLGLVVHRPLARVPENAMKFTVGALLCGFGAFWAGEGIGVAWPGADWSIPALVAGFLIQGLALARIKRAAGAAA